MLWTSGKEGREGKEEVNVCKLCAKQLQESTSVQFAERVVEDVPVCYFFLRHLLKTHTTIEGSRKNLESGSLFSYNVCELLLHSLLVLFLRQPR